MIRPVFRLSKLPIFISVMPQNTLLLLYSAFVPFVMSRFDEFLFGSNPLCSSNIIFVFYIFLIISLLVPLLLSPFPALTPSVNILTSNNAGATSPD